MMYLDNGNITIIKLHGELSQHRKEERLVLISKTRGAHDGEESRGCELINPLIHTDTLELDDVVGTVGVSTRKIHSHIPRLHDGAGKANFPFGYQYIPIEIDHARDPKRVVVNQ